jgi:hypothetical protein
MGLSIHYRGSFKQGASLPKMIEEVKEISEILKWGYSIFETEFPENLFGKEEYDENLYGICFSLPKSEPIFLSFLSNGILCSPVALQYFSVYSDSPSYEYMQFISVKTQFAGIEAHKIIIHLLDYLSKKYLDNFSLSDEGEYWETRDEKKLQEIFNRYNSIIDSFALGLENTQKFEGESVENFIERIAQKIHDKNKKD